MSIISSCNFSSLLIVSPLRVNRGRRVFFVSAKRGRRPKGRKNEPRSANSDDRLVVSATNPVRRTFTKDFELQMRRARWGMNPFRFNPFRKSAFHPFFATSWSLVLFHISRISRESFRNVSRKPIMGFSSSKFLRCSICCSIPRIR